MPSGGDAARVALVVGPTGATGKAVTAALARQGGWTVYGASRTEPGGTPPFRHVAADLMRPGTLAPALAGLAPVTHGFFCARAPFAEGGVEDVPLNVAMLEAMLDGLEASSLRLEHVHLLEGTKWYGMHLGPYRTPAREDDPRHLPPNFYYDQQDLLERRARRGGWGWSASRPSFICGFAPERPRNLVPTLGAYAAICRALRAPLDFPGTAEGYTALNEVTDVDVLGDAVLFTATHRPRATKRSTSPTATASAGRRCGRSWRTGAACPAACRATSAWRPGCATKARSGTTSLWSTGCNPVRWTRSRRGTSRTSFAVSNGTCCRTSGGFAGRASTPAWTRKR